MSEDLYDKPELQPEDIRKEVMKRLELFTEKSFLEQYSLFMGKAQILEFGLKKLLSEKYGYNFEDLEKWTLGRVSRELKKNGLRQDFIHLLEEVVSQRNYIAHDFLVDESLRGTLLADIGTDTVYTKGRREFEKSMYELEQIILLFDWTNHNNAW